ncbi:hypothetical protein ACFP81_04915 [Deinococcus lacus]|uniref:Uncharacterized protein n=1 Tax=Deinococcus lacus TaxID=392561 RepID=A0ABW1YD02_9DEIO
MRCRDNPQRQLRREYWPGAGSWGGENIVWTTEKVTYFPKGFGKVTVKQHAFTLAGVKAKLPCK